GAKLFKKSIPAKTSLNVRPGDVVQRNGFGQHHFAVLKFERVGLAGLRKAVNLSAAGELIEDRVQRRITQRAQVSHFDAETGQRVGENRAVAAELGAFRHHFDVRAAARSSG